MQEKQLTFFDRFLYKLFIGIFLLLGLVTLDYFKIVSYDNIKSSFNTHYNVLGVIKKINGKTNIIPIDLDETISVSTNSYTKSEKLIEGRKIILDDYEAVENYALGIIVEITRKKDKTYTIVIKGIDNLEYIYENLESIDCNLYQYVESGEIIGKASNENNSNYFIFRTYNNDKYVDILGGYEN